MSGNRPYVTIRTVEDGWFVFVEVTGDVERELLRCQPPPNLKVADAEAFIAHLLAEVQKGRPS